jgi:hypothetical protein
VMSGRTLAWGTDICEQQFAVCFSLEGFLVEVK